MHYCGNPVHDILFNAAMAAPFAGVAVAWVKFKVKSAKDCKECGKDE